VAATHFKAFLQGEHPAVCPGNHKAGCTLPEESPSARPSPRPVIQRRSQWEIPEGHASGRGVVVGPPQEHLRPTGANCPVWGGRRICATRGWISVDRGSKATLPLTMPRRVFKSSAKDSARRPFGIVLQGGRPRQIRHGGLANGTGPWGTSPYCGSVGERRALAPHY
jgi:hypothetical protein